MEITETLQVPEEVRKKIIFERDSKRMTKAVKTSWGHYPSLDAKRRRLAPSHYALQVKRHGKEVAWQWLVKNFGEEQAENFLIEWARKEKMKQAV